MSAAEGQPIRWQSAVGNQQSVISISTNQGRVAPTRKGGVLPPPLIIGSQLENRFTLQYSRDTDPRGDITPNPQLQVRR